MPQLLLELFSEEIPARMQGQAAKDLERLMLGALTDRGLLTEGARSFATPRRLTLVIEGLPAEQPDVSEERKGPRVSAPDAALQGFLKSTGLTKEQLKVQKDPKGDFYLAVIERKGRPTADVIAEIVPEIVRGFPWPKSMRSGTNPLVWVRPLKSILCAFGGSVVPFEVGGVRSGDQTRGHRFMSEGAIVARDFATYEAALRKAHVILDAEERKRIIRVEALKAANAAGLEWIEDEALLDEVAGLVEWPVVLTGEFDKAFLGVPQEILISTMRANQKYFALAEPHPSRAAARPPQDDGRDGARHGEVPPQAASNHARRLANKFLVVANVETPDGGKAVVEGNQRVLRARLSDAKFFWDQDLKETLESRLEKLKPIVFHEKLGSQFERVERIEALAGEIARLRAADVKMTRKAARLCKADLVSQTVGEFPEVQGVIGGYLACAEKMDAAIADAIRDHYKPQGPSDTVPTAPVTIAVALADKLDTLVGFFTVAQELPTGSKDPYALRRAALGVARILTAARFRLSLVPLLERAAHAEWPHGSARKTVARIDFPGVLHEQTFILLEFICDRLKVALRDQGVRHDLIDAVFALGGQDDLVLIMHRVEALQEFLKKDDGANLLAGYKRAANILRIEEKKDKRSFDGPADPARLVEFEEKVLHTALTATREEVESEVDCEDFAAAMAALAKLRAPVDAFFDKVTVNAPDAALRENRLKLLAQIKATAHLIADFSKIEG